MKVVLAVLAAATTAVIAGLAVLIAVLAFIAAHIVAIGIAAGVAATAAGLLRAPHRRRRAQALRTAAPARWVRPTVTYPARLVYPATGVSRPVRWQ
jgi:hypothetical protein